MPASTSRDVRVRFGGDVKGLAAAAKDGERVFDRFGKNTEKQFTQSGERASKGFGAGMKRWFRGEGSGVFSELGKSGGTVFGSGLLGALKTPILGPAILAAFAALAATVLPAAGAVAAGGVVLGFGAGLAGLGLVFAAKTEAVQARWAVVLGQMGSDMRLLSQPFDATLLNMATYAERTFAKFNPALARSFEKMAPQVDRFVDGFARSLERLVPAIAPVTDAFGAVLQDLGPALDDLLGNLAGGMTELAASVNRNPAALADMVTGLGNVLRTGLDLIRILNDVNGSFATLTGGTSLVDVTMEGLRATLMPLLTLFAGFGKVLDLVNAAVGRTGKDVDGAGASMNAAANQTVLLAQGLQKTGTAALQGAAPMRTLAERIEATKKKAQEQAAAFEAGVQAMFRLQNLSLGLSGAQINLQASLDEATASLKENGRTLDINSAKGRANRTALNGIAQSANAQTEAMIRAGKSQSTAGLAAERSRANFVRVAMQMGLSRKQALAMAASMIAIPNVSREARLTANKKDLEAKLAAAKRELANPNLTKTRRATLTAEISRLKAGVADAKASLASLPSTKTVTINTYRNMIETTTRRDVGVRAPGRASGGLTQPNRRYLVGERGPEILELGNTGGRVTANERLHPGAPAAPMAAEIHIEIGGEVVRVVRTELKADKRDLKRKAGAR